MPRFILVAALLTITVLGIMSETARAAVITTGDVTPTDPATWTNTTIGLIGNTADGSVTVTEGSAIRGFAKLGITSGVTGTLTVDGLNSLKLGNLYAGGDTGAASGGTGIVTISNGGVGNASDFRLGLAPGAAGILNITNGGSLISGTNGIGFAAGSTGMATVDGVGSRWDGGGGGSSVQVGLFGNGLFRITNGATVISAFGGVGGNAGATGRVILDGAGSKWTNGNSFGDGFFTIGQRGTGLVTVTNAANLTIGFSQGGGPLRLGQFTGGNGTLMINGAGSTLANPLTVNIGGTGVPTTTGTGRLSVSDGGSFTAGTITINSNNSVMTTDLGTGSTVTVGGGAGSITNDGTIRMAAKATAANGTYAPISAGSWSGSGTVQALGGVYDAATHSVTVSSAATGQAGIATTIDRSVTQRIVITDGATGKQVGASFQAAIAPTSLSLTASLMNNSQLNLLQGLLDPGKAILSGWDFSATGYTVGDPVYLSLQVGSGQKFYDLDIWHFNGTSWGKYLNTDLAYDNTFASFVATGFSGYAVSGVAAVPVPAAVWLFGSGLAAAIGLRKRNLKSVA